MACPLPGHHSGEEVVWLRHHLAMSRSAQSSPGSTHFTYIIICVRLSVSATCKLWFCCPVLYMQHLKHVCPSRERDRSSVALCEISSIFSLLFNGREQGKFFLSQFKGLMFKDVVHCTDCKARWGNVVIAVWVKLIRFELTLAHQRNIRSVWHVSVCYIKTLIHRNKVEWVYRSQRHLCIWARGIGKLA